MLYFIGVITILLAGYGSFVLGGQLRSSLTSSPVDRALASFSKKPADWSKSSDVYIHKSGLIAISSTTLYGSDVKLSGDTARYNATNTMGFTAQQNQWFERILKGFKEKKATAIVSKALKAEKEALKATKSDEKAVKRIKEAGTF